MNRNLFFGIVRWLSVALFVIAIVLLGNQNKISSADFETVSSAVTGTLDLTEMQKGNDLTVKRLYGLNPENYENVMIYWPLSNMDAKELLLIKLKDTSQQDEIVKAVEARLETQKKSFDGYGIEQYALLTDNSVLDVKGNYILFVVNSKCADADRVFRAAL